MRRILAAAIVGSLTFTSIAHADVIPPDVDACQGKTAGEACSVMESAGACKDDTCSRVNYGAWDKDAMPSPPTTSYACVRCIAGATPTKNVAPATDDKSGCSFGRSAGPFALACVPALVIGLIKRRRNRR